MLNGNSTTLDNKVKIVNSPTGPVLILGENCELTSGELGMLHKDDIKNNVIELTETDKKKLRAAELKRERKALKKGK